MFAQYFFLFRTLMELQDDISNSQPRGLANRYAPARGVRAARARCARAALDHGARLGRDEPRLRLGHADGPDAPARPGEHRRRDSCDREEFKHATS